jgi:hypothetical protein
VALLLRDVLLEVPGQERGGRICVAERGGPLARGFQDGNAGADDAMRREQELGIDLPRPRVLDQARAGGQQIRQDDGDLAAEANALGRLVRSCLQR